MLDFLRSLIWIARGSWITIRSRNSPEKQTEVDTKRPTEFTGLFSSCPSVQLPPGELDWGAQAPPLRPSIPGFTSGEVKYWEGRIAKLPPPFAPEPPRILPRTPQEIHANAMQLLEIGAVAQSRGNTSLWKSCLRLALNRAIEAIGLLADAVEPTRSIFHRSAAAIAWDLGEISVVEGLVIEAFKGTPPEDIARGLRSLEASAQNAIQRSPDICSGEARIRDTHIPVWVLVLARFKLRYSDAEILENYEGITDRDLLCAWHYYEQNKGEIDAAIDFAG